MLVESTPAQARLCELVPIASKASRMLCAVIGLILSFGCLGAQATDLLVAGARIRVVARDTTQRSDGERRFTARFVGVERDTLAFRIFQDPDRFVLPLSALTSLDVSVSSRSARRGALIGAGYGAAVGATVTAIFLARASSRPCDDCWISSEAGVLITGIPSTALSSVIGGIIFSRRQDKWRRVPVESLRSRR